MIFSALCLKATGDTTWEGMAGSGRKQVELEEATVAAHVRRRNWAAGGGEENESSSGSFTRSERQILLIDWLQNFL